MACECCDELRAELQRIRQEIANLDSRFIPESDRDDFMQAREREQINRDIGLAQQRAENAERIGNDALSLAERVEASLADLVLRFVQLSAKVTSLIEDLAALVYRVSGLEGLIQAIQQAINDVERFLEELFQSLGALLLRVADLDGLVNSLIRRIEQIFDILQGFASLSELNQLKQRVGFLEGFVDSIIQTVTALTGRVDQNSNRIGVVESGLSAVRSLANSALSEAAQALGIATDARARADNAQQTADNAIARADSARQIANDALSEAIAAARAADAAYARASEAISRVIDLESKVDQNCRDIAGLRRRINVLNALLATLDALVTGVLATLATIAAQIVRAVSLAERAISLAERAINAIEQFAYEIQEIRQLIAELIARIDREESQMSEALLNQLLQLAQQNNQLLQSSGSGVIDISPCLPEGSESQLVEATYQGSGLTGIYSAIAAITQSLNLIHTDTKCPTETAALPMFWEVKRGEIPQLVVVWRKVEGGGSSWTMTIPHPRAEVDAEYPFDFPSYKKGGNMASVHLTDNSKIIINAFSEADAQTVIDYALTLVDPQFIPSEGVKVVYSRNVASLAEVEVKAQYVKKFQGHKTAVPLWGIHLSD